MMKKIKMFLLSILAACAIFFAVSTTTAHAVTWHKYTPSAIRGTWVTKKIDFLGTKARIEVKLSKNQFYLEGNDPTILKNMYYHHKRGSHYYYIKGTEYMYTKGHEVDYYKVHKSKNWIHLCAYLSINDGHHYKSHYWTNYYYKK